MQILPPYSQGILGGSQGVAEVVHVCAEWLCLKSKYSEKKEQNFHRGGTLSKGTKVQIYAFKILICTI